ncbi:adenylate/guanylate cyclase domain-containing protein [bacterium]|nr:adenylate/guanylate cyclase domain-containing protein [bacterium]
MSLRQYIFRVGLSLLFSVIGGVLFLTPWVQNTEYRGIDLWFFLRGEEEPRDDVILVALDENSYDRLHVPMNRPWPRSLHAKLLQRMARSGARKVIFDVIFSGPSGDPAADKALEQALALLPTAIGVEIAPIAGEDREKVFLPDERFITPSTELAVVKKRTDGRYIRRFTPTYQQEPGKPQYRSLSQAALSEENTHVLPDDNDLIWFYGPSRTVRTYSYADALDEEFFPHEEFQDKIIYVGLALQTALGPAQKDAFSTPFPSKGDTFGVEIHATAALNLLHQQWISRFPLQIEALGVITALFLSTLVVLFIPPGLGFIFLCGLGAGWAFLSYSLFVVEKMFIPGFSIIAIALPLIFLGNTISSYLIAKKKQKQTEKAFSHYLSPAMAKQVSQNPEALHLGGEVITATALFTDIADFTKISESMPAKEVVTMLNDYFTEIMEAIFETEGTLIKFIGDAVFALWGAPLPLDDHEERTLLTALAIRDAVQKFNQSGKYPELFTRMGVHCGPMVVGNLGSAKRFDYTAIGDSVNLAARLEGLNKYFGTDLIFSENVAKQIGKGLSPCSLGKVAVKGKSQVKEIFTLLPEEVTSEEREIWEAALTYFHESHFEESETHCKQLLRQKSYFRTTAQLYLQQIPYRKITGTENWNGEIAFEVK